MPATKDSQYIPALRFRFLTSLFDPLLRYLMREIVFKRRLIELAHTLPGATVLDLGCGTGTLTTLFKQSNPGALVIGIDADKDVLAIAQAKAARQGVRVGFDQGMSFQPPYPAHLFDRVLSSLVLHHLTRENRRKTLREVLRTLKPSGQFLIIDFGRPQSRMAWMISIAIRRLEPAGDLIDGLLVQDLQFAGFQDVEIIARFLTVFGTIALYRTQKPSTWSECGNPV